MADTEYWQKWEKKDISAQFQFAKSWGSSLLPWSSNDAVCGELSKMQGQEWVATLCGANTVSVCVCVCTCVCVCACIHMYVYHLYVSCMRVCTQMLLCALCS